MGRIFGISDLPVSTIMTPFEPIEVPKLNNKTVNSTHRATKKLVSSDKFISKSRNSKSNAFIKMRNGFGKLMKHFSKVK